MFPWNMFPFNKNLRDTLQKMKPEEIEKYVQDLLEKMMPNMQGMMNPNDVFQQFQPSDSNSHSSAIRINASTYETHDHVYIRIPINNHDALKKLRLYHTSNQLIIEHFPEYGEKHTITLPAIVKKKGGEANLKDGILEIRIPKNIDMQYTEIDVTEKW
ncbi:Hsp20/alpha crystallin family protein [Neobacillus sp.]|jgi:HSP20 family molecular chaperone IbpA|uniref:Hsp20/alpha crystallin family protein n=1 Tax=Neobacillus sp. TaxID=2675273 RepID=UPI0035B54F38